MKKLKILALMGGFAAMCIGLTACMSPVDLVDDVDPVASFDTTIDDLTVSFNGSNSYDVGGDVVLWKWYFGDGVTGIGKIIEHKYDDYGVNTVTLIVTDEDGDMGVLVRDVNVEEPSPVYPVAVFSHYSLDTPIQTGSVVVFNGDASYDPDGMIVYGEWNFGDGSDPEGGFWDDASVVGHIYQALPTNNDHYSVHLTIWDDNGNIGSAWLNVYVK